MSNFSSVKHLASVLREIQNLEVREFFKDVLDSDSEIAQWFEAEPAEKPVLLSSSSGRASLKLACTIRKEDSMVAIVSRAFLFYLILGAARIQSSKIYYGIPTTHYQIQRRFQPQISLWFQEDLAEVDPDYSPVEGEISFRIMSQSAEEITNANINSWANKIKQLFGEPRYIWRKGKIMVTYAHWEKGYQFQLLSRSKSDGESLIRTVLEIQNHKFERRKMNHSTNEAPTEAYPVIPPSQSRRGKQVRMPRKRPIADVKFCHALLHLWGEPNPIVLVDYQGRYPNPIVR